LENPLLGLGSSESTLICNGGTVDSQSLTNANAGQSTGSALKLGPEECEETEKRPKTWAKYFKRVKFIVLHPQKTGWFQVDFYHHPPS
jgi:hypothetical protein